MDDVLHPVEMTWRTQWLRQMPASERGRRRRAVRAAQGCSEFADIVRVLRCGQTPVAWASTPEAIAAHRKERNARKALRRARTDVERERRARLRLKAVKA